MKIGLPNNSFFNYLARLPVTIKTLVLLALMLGISLIVTASLFEGEMERYRQSQQQLLGEHLGQQAAQMAASQILAKDWVSLAVTASQLTEHPQISGVEIIDSKQQALAQSGSVGGRTHITPIALNGGNLGEIRLHLDDAPLARDLSIAFYRTSLAAIITALFCWGAVFIYLRRLNPPLRQLIEASEALRRGHPIERLTINRNDELGTIAGNLNQRFAPPEPEPELEQSLESEPLPAPKEPTDARPTAAEYRPDDTDQVRAAPVAEEAPSLPGSDSPLIASAAENTVNERRYLLYVDHCSTASDNLTADERSQLLHPYRRCLEQVGALYKGTCAEDEEGNWWVGFTALDGEQSHGINALCAAQLFNALYRGTNQRAIRQMNPVANIKMSLLCGRESFDALLQEAPVLCRTIEANTLIVDEQLFTVPQLNQRLLGEAQCRALEQPARLLNSLAPDYQALIDKQAEHFLNQA